MKKFPIVATEHSGDILLLIQRDTFRQLYFVVSAPAPLFQRVTTRALSVTDSRLNTAVRRYLTVNLARHFSAGIVAVSDPPHLLQRVSMHALPPKRLPASTQLSEGTLEWIQRDTFGSYFLPYPLQRTTSSVSRCSPPLQRPPVVRQVSEDTLFSIKQDIFRQLFLPYRLQSTTSSGFRCASSLPICFQLSHICHKIPYYELSRTLFA